MVEDAWNRDVGFTYKPKKANVAPINPGWDDRRSAHLRKSFADNVNAVRERRATWENPNWFLAQDPERWKDQSFRDKARPVLSQLKGNQDFWTTDQDESRNMYQMVMNNMYGGKGAQMLDMRGLPTAVQADPNKYRRGRTLFQDPSKSQGFFGDLASMVLRRPNPAAVRAPEWNPLYDHGYARDWYVDKFGQPWGEKLAGIMKLAAPGPLKFIKGKEKKPLPSDRSWIPEGLGEYDEVPYIPFMGDELVDDDLNIFDIFLENSQIPTQFDIQKLRDEGRSGFINPEDLIPTDVEEVLDDEITDNIDVEIKEKPPFPGDDILTEEETINNQYSFVNEMDHFDSPYDYIMEFKARNENLDIDAIIQNAILNGIIIENNV